MLKDIFYKFINSFGRPKLAYGEYPAEHFDIYGAGFGPGRLIVKDFTSIAKGTRFILADNHFSALFSMYPFGFNARTLGWCEPQVETADITVGHDAWIGAGVTVNKGVAIGNGAVVCAGSVVLHDVKPYSVVAGNPAQFMFYRFNKETIDLLQELKWWDWEEEKIKRNLHILRSNDYDKLLALKGR